MSKFQNSNEPSLFTYFSKPKKGNPLKRIRNWGGERKSSFTLPVYASIVFHVFIILFVIIQSSIFTQSDRVTNYNSKQAVTGAYAELQNMLPIDLDIGTILTPELQSLLSENLENLNISGEKMAEEEVSELFSKMLDTYLKSSGWAIDENMSDEDIREDFNNFLKKSIEWKLDSGKKVFLSTQLPGNEELNFKVVSEKTLANLDYLERVAYTKTNHFYIYGAELVRVQTQEGMKYIPAGQFYRDSPFEELLANGAELFYVIRGFPSIWEPPIPEQDSIKSQEQSHPTEFDESITVFLTDHLPASAKRISSDSSPESVEFNAPDDSIQIILDELMIHPDMTQLEMFKQNYLERYDINSEDLITLTNRFIQNNLTNVLIFVSDVSAAFDFVEQVYFNKPLDSYFFSLWMQNPTSRIGVEFLLCLASHYDFERRALEYLFKADKDAIDFIEGKSVNAEIHDKIAKTYVIKKVNQDLVMNLSKLGYESRKEALTKYLEEEEKIYLYLIQMGGDGTNIGLYALGSFYWSREKYNIAIQHWQRIDPTYSHNIALQEIRDVLLREDDLSRAITQINRILDYYRNKGTKALLERLVRFKRWKNRYSE